MVEPFIHILNRAEDLALHLRLLVLPLMKLLLPLLPLPLPLLLLLLLLLKMGTSRYWRVVFAQRLPDSLRKCALPRSFSSSSSPEYQRSEHS